MTNLNYSQFEEFLKSRPLDHLTELSEQVDPELAKKISASQALKLNEMRESLRKKEIYRTNWAVKSWVTFVNILFDGIEVLAPQIMQRWGRLGLLADMERQKGMIQLTPAPIDPSAAITAMFRDPDVAKLAQENLKRHGFSGENRQLLAKAAARILQDPEIRDLWLRSKITDDAAKTLLTRHGMSRNDASALMKTWVQPLGPGEVRDAYLRGLIGEQGLKTRLKNFGLRDEDQEISKKLFYYIPPIQDLIRLSVREVFTPELAAKFGLYQDYPTELTKYAGQQGLSEEWAKRYWAAHWELPGMHMGYEMFHRRIIDADELDMLMKAQDISPFWRPKLRELSYNPLTRVDVRRMHAFGVLTDEEVYESYLDGGYSPKNAQRMADFTVKYNTEQERDLTKTEIVAAYITGIMERRDAIDQLMDLGYSEDDADVVLTVAEVKRNNTLVAKRAKAVAKRYEHGVINRKSAKGELTALGLTEDAVSAYLEDAEAEMEMKVQTLSRDDCDKALKKGIIKPQEYRARLDKMGYNKKDIDILEKLHGGA